MDFLLNPNIAYLVLVAAMLFTLVAIITPGTGIAEVLALFSLLLAGYAVYNPAFNWWALALLILSAVRFWLWLSRHRFTVASKRSRGKGFVM